MLTYHLGLPSNPVNPNGSLSKSANIRHQPVLRKHPTGYLCFIHTSILSHPIPTGHDQAIKDITLPARTPFGHSLVKADRSHHGKANDTPASIIPPVTALRRQTPQEAEKRPHRTGDATSLFERALLYFERHCPCRLQYSRA